MTRRPDPSDLGRRAADPVIASGDHSETMRHVMTRTLGPLLGLAGIILGGVVAALLVWGA
jgi:hypothetical protein